MAIKLTGYKLFFNDIVLDEPIIHSDTLYGIMCDTLFALNRLQGDTLDLPFTISSAFPFFDNYYFFPKPADFYEKFLCRHKDCRHNLFVSQTVLQNYLNDNLKNSDICQTGCFISEQSHPVHMVYPLFKQMKFPKLYLNNILKFKDNSGLFFLVKPAKNSSLKLLETTLNFLQDEGIGAKRSIGRGYFRYEKFSLEFSSENIKKHLLLSLYLPKKTDISKPFFKNSYIDWIKRTKNPFFNLIKEAKSVYMAKEGAVFFNMDNQKPKGEIIKFFNANKKLGTQTPVYRFGKSFFLE
ncbi:type III-A CRISPR-associated RAMP protein Csm4 [bacterium]|nr:type III-A CRISPR-associated RAMP protein Csm4 [bacterium]